MALSTDVYWDIAGVPLQTYAYNITTWGGDLQAPPTLRGEDTTLPYRPGTIFQTRRPTGRSITFNMWVTGADVDGNVPASKTMRLEFEKNFKMLRGLFWNQGKQVAITKRWKDYTTGVVQAATGYAVFVNGLAPTMNGQLRATFTVEMYMSDPFFYGTTQTVNFAGTTTSNQSPTVLGDYETTAISLDVNGARNNFRLTNTSESVYVNVNKNLSAGQLVRLDVNNFTARQDPSGANTNVIGSVTNFGHPFWMVLRPGVQNLSLTSSTGAGTATLTYLPRWI